MTPATRRCAGDHSNPASLRGLDVLQEFLVGLGERVVAVLAGEHVVEVGVCAGAIAACNDASLTDPIGVGGRPC